MRRRLLAMCTLALLLTGVSGASTVAPSYAIDYTRPIGYLRVITDPPVPSTITIGSAPGNDWGAWVRVNVGYIHVCFGTVRGYETPPCQYVTVEEGETATVTGVFTPLARLRVVTSPAVPAAIVVDGATQNNWGAWYTTTPGAHTVCFGPVAGYDPPPCQTIDAARDATTLVTGVFTPNPSAPGPTNVGSLRVTTSPPAPLRIWVNGVYRDEWGLNWMDFPPGDVRACAAIGGEFMSPPDNACQSGRVVAGETLELTVPTLQMGSIRATTQPALPSTVSVLGSNDWGLWGKVVPGLHTACWSHVPGFSRPPCKDVTVAPGQQVDVPGVFGPPVTNVSRFAGTGTAGLAGDGGPALDAQLTSPHGMARAPDGSIYVSDPTAGRVRRIAPNGTITTVAGCDCPAWQGHPADNAPATAVELRYPAGLTFDAGGHLYIAESGAALVRRVDRFTGIITTVAGNRRLWSQYEPMEEYVPATATPLNQPMSVAFDASGNLYVLDSEMHRIRRVGTNGLISTFAGGGTTEGEGIPATSAAIGEGQAMLIAGNALYYADWHVVRRISLTTNAITTVAGSMMATRPITPDPYDGTPVATQNLRYLGGIAIDAAGNLFLVDTGRNLVRRVDAQTKIITTIYDGMDQPIPANGWFACGPGCLIRPTAQLVIRGQDLLVTYAGEHIIRRIAGVVPAGA